MEYNTMSDPETVIEPTQTDAVRECRMTIITTAGYNRKRVPVFAAEPIDCSGRRGEHFVASQSGRKGSICKGKMYQDGTDVEMQDYPIY
jgi:hypothetical protein